MEYLASQRRHVWEVTFPPFQYSSETEKRAGFTPQNGGPLEIQRMGPHSSPDSLLSGLLRFSCGVTFFKVSKKPHFQKGLRHSGISVLFIWALLKMLLTIFGGKYNHFTPIVQRMPLSRLVSYQTSRGFLLAREEVVGVRITELF